HQTKPNQTKPNQTKLGKQQERSLCLRVNDGAKSVEVPLLLYLELQPQQLLVARLKLAPETRQGLLATGAAKVRLFVPKTGGERKANERKSSPARLAVAAETRAWPWR